jgi:hypothetical protein
MGTTLARISSSLQDDGDIADIVDSKPDAGTSSASVAALDTRVSLFAEAVYGRYGTGA